jgi:hypothetical protein
VANVISINSELKVMETCGALSRPHASPRSGVVSADILAQYQGTGLSFAGFGGIAVDGTPRTDVRVKGEPSGITTWSPPV